MTKKEIIEFLERECKRNWEGVELFNKDDAEENKIREIFTAKWIELDYCLGVIKGTIEEVNE